MKLCRLDSWLRRSLLVAPLPEFLGIQRNVLFNRQLCFLRDVFQANVLENSAVFVDRRPLKFSLPQEGTLRQELLRNFKSVIWQHVRSHDAAEAGVEGPGVFFAFHAGTHAIADTVLITAHE